MTANVHDYADKLLEILSEERLDADSLKITENTFDSVRNLLNNNQLFPNYEGLNLLKIHKSDDLASEHRLRGNLLFNDQKYFSALCAYNDSLCYAELGSESVGLAYANRSAVFLKIQEFDLCQKNVKVAKDFGYPKNLFSKLDTREKICNKKKRERNSSEVFTLQLSNKSNPKYPFMAECLRLKCNSEFGRHIVTETDLKPGEIIAIEKPYCSLLLSNFSAKRCANCLGQIKLNLLPCPCCTSGKTISSNMHRRPRFVSIP